jgi:hypothetical protein
MLAVDYLSGTDIWLAAEYDALFENRNEINP